MDIKVGDLMDDGARPRRHVVGSYRYLDRDGQTLHYEKLRYEPKSFAFRRPDGNADGSMTKPASSQSCMACRDW